MIYFCYLKTKPEWFSLFSSQAKYVLPKLGQEKDRRTCSKSNANFVFKEIS